MNYFGRFVEEFACRVTEVRSFMIINQNLPNKTRFGHKNELSSDDYGFGEDFILSPDFIPGGKNFNVCYFGEVLLSIQKKLKNFEGTVSKKYKKGRIEYYLQFRRGGKRREVYIPKKQLQAVLMAYEKKKRLKTAFSQMKKVLSAMPSELRKQVRQAMKICEEEHILGGREEERRYLQTQSPDFPAAGEIYADGTHLRSRAELVCWNEIRRFGLDSRYENAIHVHWRRRRKRKTYYPDFTIRRRDGSICFWEHMGRLEKADYANRQRQKLRDYRGLGICAGKNLIITVSRDNFDARRMRWAMTCGGIIDVGTSLKDLRKLKKRKTSIHEFFIKK